MNNFPDNIKDPSQFAVLKILTGKNKGKQFRLLGGKIRIGLSSNCDIILKNNASCSKEHALISYDSNKKSYIIESLNQKNPVIVNKKPIQAHLFKRKDIVTIGSLMFQFSDQSKPPSSQGYQKLHKDSLLQKQKNKKKVIRVIFVAAILAFGFMFLLQTESKKEQTKKGLKTEQDLLEEVELVETLNEEERLKNKPTQTTKQARQIFLKGFRDYRKGHYYRAIKLFEHCTTIQKSHSLCRSYANKSKTQLQKLIQRKVVLGKSYKDNNQYAACVYTFKSVEMMVQDINSAVFKEARAFKNLCEAKIENIF